MRILTLISGMTFYLMLLNNESFFARIKSKPIEKLQGAIIVSSTWNGIGSALLPTLNSQFKEWNINSVALALLPSKAQPLDGQFNSFRLPGYFGFERDQQRFCLLTGIILKVTQALTETVSPSTATS